MKVKWLKDSGLQVDPGKTKVCLFHRNDQSSIKIKVMDQEINTSKSMNILGMSRLQIQSKKLTDLYLRLN
jgi:hypothetical protein